MFVHKSHDNLVKNEDSGWKLCISDEGPDKIDVLVEKMVS